MKEKTNSEKENFSVIWVLLVLVLIAAIIPLIYLIPASIILIGYFLACLSIFITEMVVDRTSRRFHSNSMHIIQIHPVLPNKK